MNKRLEKVIGILEARVKRSNEEFSNYHELREELSAMKRILNFVYEHSMIPEIKQERFIGGSFGGSVFTQPLDCDKVKIDAGGEPETYTRRRILMPPVTWEGFALVSMSDEDVKKYLKSENV